MHPEDSTLGDRIRQLVDERSRMLPCSPSLSVEPGVYDVYVTPAGTKDTVAIEVQDLPLSGNQVLDIIARDPQTDGSEGPLPQLIVIDYASIAACTP